MKSFKRTALASLLLIAFLGAGSFALTNSTQAQEADTTDSAFTTLIGKIDQLIDTLSSLTSSSENDASDAGEIGLLAYGSPNAAPACLDEYLSFPTSNTFKADAAWSPQQFDNTTGNKIQQLADLNGDGMLDYIFHTSVATGNGTTVPFGNAITSCVLLNTGTGWNPAYRCKSYWGSTDWTYHGDCAQI